MCELNDPLQRSDKEIDDNAMSLALFIVEAALTNRWDTIALNTQRSHKVLVSKNVSEIYLPDNDGWVEHSGSPDLYEWSMLVFANALDTDSRFIKQYLTQEPFSYEEKCNLKALMKDFLELKKKVSNKGISDEEIIKELEKLEPLKDFCKLIIY